MLVPLILALAPALPPPAPTAASGPQTTREFTITRFPSEDGLEITADLYKPHPSKARPCIVLFHQARWSRGEYRQIAPRLVELGYSCLAVDLRSGGSTGGASNETAMAAIAAGKPIEYADALPDVRAALRFARDRYVEDDQPVIAWGSSYSAALVLVAVGEDPGLAQGVLSFSPGEYFARQGKPDDWVRTAAGKLKAPVFVTSARGEQATWEPIVERIPSETVVTFLPDEEGKHGSSALWPQFDCSAAYWAAVETFLAETFPTKPLGPPKRDGSDG